MKIDFVTDQHWLKLNEAVAKTVGITNQNLGVRSYFGLSHALNEIVRGLARLFPHKKSFLTIDGCGPYFDQLNLFLSMEGLQEQKLELKDLKSSDVIKNLSKDTLFMLSSFDDPLTGEIFDLAQLRKQMFDQKIMTVTLYHHHHEYYQLPSVQATEAQVLSLTPNFAVGLLGSRVARVQPLIHGLRNWAIDVAPDSYQALGSRKLEAKEKILALEEARHGGAEPFFSKDTARVFDRAVFFWRDMDGEAFVTELAQILGASLLAPGRDFGLETSSLCRWGGLRTLDWFSKQGHDSEKMRGTVVLSAEIIDDKLGARISKARENVLARQNG